MHIVHLKSWVFMFNQLDHDLCQEVGKGNFEKLEQFLSFEDYPDDYGQGFT